MGNPIPSRDALIELAEEAKATATHLRERMIAARNFLAIDAREHADRHLREGIEYFADGSFAAEVDAEIARALSDQPDSTDDGLAELLREALQETVNRFEYAADMFHNVEHWHGEEAPDGSDLAEWVWAPSRAALSTGRQA